MGKLVTVALLSLSLAGCYGLTSARPAGPAYQLPPPPAEPSVPAASIGNTTGSNCYGTDPYGNRQRLPC